MRSQVRHIQHITRTPVMACTPPPSTTTFLPCLLEIITAAITSLFTGIGTLGPDATSFFETIVLSIRNLPWKTLGPVL